jgi:hypothetical protein
MTMTTLQQRWQATGYLARVAYALGTLAILGSGLVVFLALFGGRHLRMITGSEPTTLLEVIDDERPLENGSIDVSTRVVAQWFFEHTPPGLAHFYPRVEVMRTLKPGDTFCTTLAIQKRERETFVARGDPEILGVWKHEDRRRTEVVGVRLTCGAVIVSTRDVIKVAVYVYDE